MPRRIASILRHLAPIEAVPNADLLARFATSRDEAAFELLVWRHAGMVLRVWVRPGVIQPGTGRTCRVTNGWCARLRSGFSSR
jgi:hypothetical protein